MSDYSKEAKKANGSWPSTIRQGLALATLVGVAEVAVGMSFPALGIACTAGSFMLGNSQQSLQERQEGLKVKASAMQTLFADQHTGMWDGIFLCVQALEDSVAELQRLKGSSRQDRLQWCVNEIGQKLFAVSMAVDEFIVWLSVRDYFPENFSVKNALGDERYDRIKKVFDSAQTPEVQADPEQGTRKGPGGGLLQSLRLVHS